jgi:hypothetical protein
VTRLTSPFGAAVLTLRRAHIVDMAAAEVNDLSQRGGREGEQLAMAQVQISLLRRQYRALFNAVPLFVEHRRCRHRLIVFTPLCRLQQTVRAARWRRSSEGALARPSRAEVPLVCVLLSLCNINGVCSSGWAALRRCATCCRCSVALRVFVSLTIRGRRLRLRWPKALALSTISSILLPCCA